MNNYTRNFILSITLVSTFAFAAPTAQAQEPARQGAQDVALESLRAGAVSDAGLVLAATEREVMASATAPIHETLRAVDMDFSDHEITVILVTIAVVLLIVVLV